MAGRAATEERVAVPIGLKLWLTVTVVVAVASVLLFFELSQRELGRLVAAKTDTAGMVADMLAASLAAPLDFEDAEATQAELDQVRAHPEVLWAGVFAHDEDRLVAGSGDATLRPGRTAALQPVVTAGTVTVGRAIRGRQGKPLGECHLVLSLARENAAFAETRNGTLRLCLLLALGTATVLMLIIRSQVVTPLRRLSRAARRLQRGERDVQADVGGRDEVGALGRAFDAMSAAVVDRETRLAEARQAVQELLDHMRQAIVVFDEQGRLRGIPSRAATRLFGEAALEGASLVDLLHPGAEPWQVERRALQEWIDLASLAGDAGWPDVEALAPREVTVAGPEGAPRTLELDFRPLGGAPRRIMLLITDVTEQRALEQAHERDAGEMLALRRVVGGAHVFVAFLAGARERIGACRELLEGPRFGRDEAEEAFRHLHTIRGEAHVFELAEVVGAATDAEEAVAAARRGEAPERAVLSRGLDGLEVALATARERLVALAGEEALARVPVEKEALTQLVALTRGRDDELGRLAARLGARPFGDLLGSLGERVPAWASALGKKARFEMEGRSEPVPDELANVLRGVVVHLVRNAVAHGIESPEVRVEAGKAEVGAVRVRCESTPAGCRVVVEDDGAGLAAGDDDRAFEAGFSTATEHGELAGRGVGLFAVREDLARAGYRIDLVSTPGHGARFELARRSRNAPADPPPPRSPT